MNKPFYLGLTSLKISKTVTHGFCYGYVKPNMEKNQITQ